jgi:hypothetical protein
VDNGTDKGNIRSEENMTREYVELAIKEGIPFEVRMADGRSYTVPDANSIALLGKTAIIVVENALPHILPLLTVTGLTYLQTDSSSQAA